VKSENSTEKENNIAADRKMAKVKIGNHKAKNARKAIAIENSTATKINNKTLTFILIIHSHKI
jgi:hypothetical protein